MNMMNMRLGWVKGSSRWATLSISLVRPTMCDKGVDVGQEFAEENKPQAFHIYQNVVFNYSVQVQWSLYLRKISKKVCSIRVS
jgi:hypothetical protein